jgi:hypothetical protein
LRTRLTWVGSRRVQVRLNAIIMHLDNGVTHRYAEEAAPSLYVEQMDVWSQLGEARRKGWAELVGLIREELGIPS